MKNYILIASLAMLSTSAMAEQSWWESVLNTVGLGEEQSEVDNAQAIETQIPTELEVDNEQQTGEALSALSVDGLLNSVSGNLGVTPEQAKGGIAALFNFAKQNITAEQFASLGAYLPGLDSIMQYLPMIGSVSTSGLGGLMDKASGYNESLSNLNDLNKQFESIGLDTNMIGQYAQQAKDYLDTPEGQPAKNLLADGLLKI